MMRSPIPSTTTQRPEHLVASGIQVLRSRASSLLRRGIALLAVGTAVAACASSAPLSGSIKIQGSPSLLEVISDTAGRFADANPLVRFNVALTGTSDGIALLCDGLAPIATAARDLTEAERTSCRESNVTPVRLLLSRDAVVLVTRPADGPPRCLSYAGLYALLGIESFGVNTWEGSPLIPESERPSLPSGPLAIFGPPVSSGIMEVVADQGLSQEAATRGADANARGDYTGFESEALVRDATVRTPGSLGVLTLAALNIKGRALSPVSIDTGDGCIEPSTRNVRSASYPLTRPSFLFVSERAVTDSAPLKKFVDLILDPSTTPAIQRSGGILPTKAESAEVRQTWASAVAKAESNK
jgi:phosphate transport system substrate-binding protein